MPGPRRRGVRQRVGQRSMGGAAGGRRGVVVHGGPDQRVAERQAVTIQRDETLILRQLQPGHPEVLCGEGVHDVDEVAVRFGGGDEQCGQCRRRKPLEPPVDDTVPRRSDRQWIRQCGEACPLFGVEELGRLDEDQGNAAASCDELVADVHAVDTSVDQDAVGDLIGDRVEVHGWPGVGHRVTSCPPGRYHRDPLELQAARDVRQRPTSRRIDPRQIIGEHDDGPSLCRLDEQDHGRRGRQRTARPVSSCRRATAPTALPGPEQEPTCRAHPGSRRAAWPTPTTAARPRSRHLSTGRYGHRADRKRSDQLPRRGRRSCRFPAPRQR